MMRVFWRLCCFDSGYAYQGPPVNSYCVDTIFELEGSRCLTSVARSWLVCWGWARGYLHMIHIVRSKFALVVHVVRPQFPSSFDSPSSRRWGTGAPLAVPLGLGECWGDEEEETIFRW